MKTHAVNRQSSDTDPRTRRPPTTILFDLHRTLIFQSVRLPQHLARVLEDCGAKLRLLQIDRFLAAWTSVEASKTRQVQRSLTLLKRHRNAEAAILLAELSPFDFMSEVLLAAQAKASQATIRAASNAFQESWMDGLRVGTGVLPLLRRLKGKYTLGIVSNFRDAKRLRAWLRVQHMSEYFGACIVISQEVGVRKPHPRIFSKALSILSVNPLGALYVGDDSLEDEAGALISGMTPAIVQHCPPECAASLRSTLRKLHVEL